MVSFFKKAFWILCSLKLAIAVMLSITAALIAATFLESAYDVQSARYWVYQATWFSFLLGFLGLEIFLVAMSRYPWKKTHIPFLVAHAGIILTLLGSWMTQKFGLDGHMRVSEGDTRNIVELPEHLLVMSEDQEIEVLPVSWIPPQVQFEPKKLETKFKIPLQIANYITHAEPKIEFTEHPDQVEKSTAIQIEILGGPMQIRQDFWLWAGDPNWSSISMGPAQFFMNYVPAREMPGPWMAFSVQEKYKKIEVTQKASSGKISNDLYSYEEIQEKNLVKEWKMVQVSIKNLIPSANNQTRYVPSRIQSGAKAPPPAILLKSGSEEMWLGLGDRASFEHQNRNIKLAYLPRQKILPFSIKLDQFEIESYPGTQMPSSFASIVQVVDQGNADQKIKISMNEPLKHKGITFYQASYEDGSPRPTTSILSVNHDPGRLWKYVGSLAITLGTIMLFIQKLRNRRKRMPDIPKAKREEEIVL